MNNDEAPGASARSRPDRPDQRPRRHSQRHRNSQSQHGAPSRHGTGLSDPTGRRRRRSRQSVSARSPQSAAVMEKVSAGLKKKLKFLTELMSHLDMLVFAELCTLYYMDCSFFRLFIRGVAQSFFLSPKSDDFLLITLAHRPHVYAVCIPNAFCFLIHLLVPLTTASEASRGYLHGGVMIDFIGQRAPTSRSILLLLDILILTLQCVMLSVHTEREKLRRLLLPKRRANSMANSLLNPQLLDAASSNGQRTEGTATPPAVPPPLRWPGQNHDAEERGVLTGGPSPSLAENVTDNIELQPIRPRRSRRSRRSTLQGRSNGATDLMSGAVGTIGTEPSSSTATSTRGNTETAEDDGDDSPWDSNGEGNIRDEEDGPPRRRRAEEAADYVLNSLSTGANINDFYVIHSLREASRDYQGVTAQSLQTFGYAARLARIARERGARLTTRPQPQ